MSESNQLQYKLLNVGDRSSRIELDCADPLLELELVRIVPNKRLVCKCIWRKQAVFAKIFLGENAERYAQRDKRGVDWLIAHHILTPILLAKQALASGEGVVLIYQAIEDSVNAEEAYQILAEPKRKALICEVVEAVAQHHQAALIQTDLYLKNFLLSQEKIYTLDGDGMRQYQTFSPAQSIENLSVLLSKIDVLDLHRWCPDLLTAYSAVRPDLQLDEARIKSLASQHRIKAASKYADIKVFRQCTDVTIRSNTGQFMAVSSQYAQLKLPVGMEGYDQLITSGNLLKKGNTCTVSVVDIDDETVVIKRYNIKSIGHAIGRMFRQTRASISWGNAHRLQLLGIKTPPPIALIEQRAFELLRGKAYFLSAYIDAPDIAEFYANASDATLTADTMKKTAELFYRLYLLKISHGDTKATNIKISKDGEPWLIDLDSMQQHQYDFFARKAHVRDLKRFMLNWKDQPSLYNAFVETFKTVYADHALLHAAQLLE